MRHLRIVTMAAALATTAALAGPASRPVELGRIEWNRDFTAAQEEARKTGKPMMVLFDEVPGCSTCKQFGQGPLSHPLVVDASRLFVSACVYNNAKGADADILKRFKEPAWNNPVVRFLDADGKDIIPRQDGGWTTPALVKRIVAALQGGKVETPEYLRLLNAELNPSARQTATFVVGCYWTGEQKLGAVEGVIASRIGMMKGGEVVEVEFDPAVVDYAKLVERVQAMKCASRVYARSDEQLDPARAIFGKAVERSDAKVDTRTQQQYNLMFKPAYHYLPLTSIQATRINSAVASRQDADRFLSPSQLALKTRIEKLLAADGNLSARMRKQLKPDRSAEGIIGYAAALDAFLDSAENAEP
jgi:hypothetical protein